MRTPDFTDENIARLAELFPNCVTESKDENGNLKRAIDFDQLRQELSGNIVEGPQERYHLDWPGKREALLTANAPIAKTLRPSREESVDFDTTKNLYIEGDNLDALKLLQETYLGKVKMIYIDPPYNTGNDFIYEDDFAEDKDAYFERSMQKDEEGNRLVVNAETNGRFHSDWLTMMYSRLRLARNLLADTGVIVVHIDEHEYPNLEKLLSEVLGEQNNVGTIIWDKRNPKGDATGVAQQHELISIYCKDRAAFKEKVDFRRTKENAAAMMQKASDLIKQAGGVTNEVRSKYKAWIATQEFSGGEKAYNLIDAAGEIYRPVSMAWPNKKTAPADYHVPLIHPTTGQACPVPDRGWRNPSATMQKLLEANLILFGTDHTTQPNRKYLLRENTQENVPSLLYFGGSDDALFQEIDLYFDNPKPLAVAKKLISPVCQSGDLIVDFFSGSATAAHAVMKLNEEDGGNRSFIMVQLPEEPEEESEASKAGYKTIAEIGKERIRRAGKKIKEEAGLMGANLDIGFRVLKVDTSNMKDVYYSPDSAEQRNLLDQVGNIKEDRTSEDLLFQVLLDWGVDLALPISKETVSDRTVFFVDNNALVACFDTGIDEDFVKQLANRKPLRVVFRDSGFASDAAKINVEQIFKLISPTTEVKSI